jgi:hypothetical protein
MLPTSHCLPYTTSFRSAGPGHLQLRNSLDQACSSIRWSIWSSEIGSVFPLKSILRSLEPVKLGVYNSVQLSAYFRVCLEVYLWISPELTLEHTLKQAGSVPSSAIGRVLESMPGSGLASVLGVYFVVSCEHTWQHKSSRMGVCHEEQLGIYSQTGWVCAIEWNQEYTSKRTWQHVIKCIW